MTFLDWSYSFPPCVPEFAPEDHRHSRRCVVRVMRELPAAPDGWRWMFENVAGDWIVYLQRVGGSGRWFVVGLPVSSSASDLVSVVWAYCQGYRHK